METPGEQGSSLIRPWRTITVLGVPIARLDPATALAEVERLYEEAAPALVAYANAHTLNLACADPTYREVLRSAAIVLNDGSGLSLAARLQGQRFPANLNGTDFTPMILCLAARKGWPVYLLGAKPGVAEAAAERLQGSIPDLIIAGTQHGYFSPDDTESVVQAIREAGTGLLLAAMGNPLQEQWLARHLADTGAQMGIGVGAFFDFTAQIVRRAPGWMSRTGIEWVYRLAQEPQRMWRRYLVGNGLFIGRVIVDNLRPARLNPDPADGTTLGSP